LLSHGPEAYINHLAGIFSHSDHHVASSFLGTDIATWEGADVGNYVISCLIGTQQQLVMLLVSLVVVCLRRSWRVTRNT
jgi:hypothetical protein